MPCVNQSLCTKLVTTACSYSQLRLFGVTKSAQMVASLNPVFLQCLHLFARMGV